jgi:uncharacterized protein YlzI (FlbEa/FlbD family)
MITLTNDLGKSVTINPDKVEYLNESERGTVIFFSNQTLYVKESYLEVAGLLKASTGGCCR